MAESSSPDRSGPPPAKKFKNLKSLTGAATYKSKYNPIWQQDFPCIQPVVGDPHSFYCSVCEKSLTCHHSGKGDVTDHLKSQRHKGKAESKQAALRNQSTLSFASSGTLNEKIIRAETKVAIALAQNNIPMSFAYKLNVLLKDIFPDSKIAQGYACGKTKTTCILNEAVAPSLKQELVQALKKEAFSLCVDGSNDVGLKKMNPISVRLYDVNHGKIVSRLLDMGCTSGVQSATAATIFEKMNSVLSESGILWDNCVGVGVDNTSVNIGRNNSIMTRVLEKNPNTAFMGCPCHIMHNTVSFAAKAYTEVTGFNLEELAIDLFYYFDHSSKRKSNLQDYCEFNDIQYLEIIRYVSTRWLCLEMAVNRMLKLYDGLVSMFKSESENTPRFLRLQKAFSDPMTEIHLLFYSSAFPSFTTFNKFLQREDPCVQWVYGYITDLLKVVMGKFLKPTVIRSSTQLQAIDVMDDDSQQPDNSLSIGIVTRSKLRKLENEGDISGTQKKKFYNGVRRFYQSASDYMIRKFPFGSEVLQHAKFVDVLKRDEVELDDICYFLERYNDVLKMSEDEMNKVEDEFINYQLLEGTRIPSDTWEIARVKENGDYSSGEQSSICFRMDLIWTHLGSLKSPDGCSFMFKRLCKIAFLVMTIPHSNATEERIFNLIRANKTDFRHSLDLEGTLTSIIIIKMAELPLKFKPSKEMLEDAKKSTWSYNISHPF